MGEALKDIKFHACYSSNLPRAHTTASIILGKSAINKKDSLIQTPFLREISFGVRDGLPRSLTYQEATEEYARINGMSVGDVVDPAETEEETLNRQNQLIRMFFKNHPLENLESSEEPKLFRILCVSHGSFIRRFIANFLGKSFRGLLNCSVNIITINKPEYPKSEGDFLCSALDDQLNMMLF